MVNPARAKFGLGPLPEASNAFTSILHQQKEVGWRSARVKLLALTKWLGVLCPRLELNAT